MARYRYVDSGAGLRAVAAALAEEPRFALDTEFHRERTYRPQAALIQIAWPGDLVLLDPLAADAAPLADAFRDETLVVAHAAEQDLEVLECVCGAVPRRIFDTQIAAGFVGQGMASLSSLYKSEIGWRPPKADRFTDWLVRPLKRSQLDYAAGDVMHLLEVHDRLTARLTGFGRLGWAEAEFERLLSRSRDLRRPEDAWMRIKEVRRMRRRDLPVVRAVAMWREHRAEAVNRPVRHILSDIVVVAIAQAAPRTPEELAKVRGVSGGLAGGRMAAAILRAVEDGLGSDWSPPPWPPAPSDIDQDLLPVVGLLRAWMDQLARQHKIAPSLLGTRADITALLRGDAGARLTQGWRAEMVGEPIRKLVDGAASLAFDRGELLLEQRSRRPLN